MKKIVKRLIVFFIGIPALLSVIIFLPQYNHLVFNLGISFFTILGALEFRTILAQKDLAISTPEALIMGAISPIAWTLVVSFGISVHIVPGLFIMAAVWLLVSRLFTSADKLDSYIGRTTAGFSLMIYPGLFAAWIIQMSALNNASMVILVFMLVVLLNDALAWVAGNLFGDNNRGLIAASPNKSIAGFAGGLAASVALGILAAVFIPDAFSAKCMPSAAAGAILGLGTGIAAILGDLGESAIKRSAGVKDSGTLIMGRGGVLDTIDSVILAAPVFYLLYRILF
jgi:phosphatidate cytidylyltransferase